MNLLIASVFWTDLDKTKILFTVGLVDEYRLIGQRIGIALSSLVVTIIAKPKDEVEVYEL